MPFTGDSTLTMHDHTIDIYSIHYAYMPTLMVKVLVRESLLEGGVTVRGSIPRFGSDYFRHFLISLFAADHADV